MFRAVDPHWHTSCYATGLASGEGLISSGARPIIKADPKTGMDEVIDPGITDKRLLVFAGEFASILAVMSRAGNILGGLLRQASDGEDLHNEAKNNPLRATAPHITVEGHITQRELTAALDTTSVFNGFLNRFLVVCCRRSCELPFGDEDNPVDPVVFGRFVAAVSAAVALADRTGRIRMDDAAKAAVETGIQPAVRCAPWHVRRCDRQSRDARGAPVAWRSRCCAAARPSRSNTCALPWNSGGTLLTALGISGVTS